MGICCKALGWAGMPCQVTWPTSTVAAAGVPVGVCVRPGTGVEVRVGVAVGLGGAGSCQIARQSDGALPAVVKWPPTYTSVPLMAIVDAKSLRPLPKAVQLLPFHLAMRLAP